MSGVVGRSTPLLWISPGKTKKKKNCVDWKYIAQTSDHVHNNVFFRVAFLWIGALSQSKKSKQECTHTHTHTHTPQSIGQLQVMRFQRWFKICERVWWLHFAEFGQKSQEHLSWGSCSTEKWVCTAYSMYCTTACTVWQHVLYDSMYCMTSIYAKRWMCVISKMTLAYLTWLNKLN